MSKKTFIHAENNNKILSSNEVKLYVPPEPEKMKVIIWGKELCNGAEWYDFLKCVEEKTRENDQLKQQLAEKQNTIDEINKEFVQAVHDWKTLCAEKDKEIEDMDKDLVFNANEIKRLIQEKKQLKQNQKELAIQELEKVKMQLKDKTKMMSNEEHCYQQKVVSWIDICDQINNQIKELKGE